MISLTDFKSEGRLFRFRESDPQIVKSSKYIHLSEVFAILIIILHVGVVIDLLLGFLRIWLFPYVRNAKQQKFFDKFNKKK